MRILEDEEKRIEKLKEIVPGAEIKWTEQIDDFLATFDTSNWDLVIMDYALGWDAGNGLQAAERMQTCAIPVVIWSGHPYGVLAMRDTLQRKGFDVYTDRFDGWSELQTIRNLCSR